MKAIPLAIPDVVLIEPQVFGDERSFFFGSFNQAQFEAAFGKPVQFVQDNHSRSVKNVLRGLHYKIQQPQGKLVRVVQGEVFDVAVDLRKSNETFGQWVGKSSLRKTNGNSGFRKVLLMALSCSRILPSFSTKPRTITRPPMSVAFSGMTPHSVYSGLMEFSPSFPPRTHKASSLPKRRCLPDARFSRHSCRNGGQPLA